MTIQRETNVFEKNRALNLSRFSSSLSLQELFSFIVPLVVYILTLNLGGGQSENIIGMQSSMIQTHTFNVLQPGMDLVTFRGQNYNVYAPGFAFLSFPFAALGFVSYGSMLGYVGNAIVMDEVFLAISASLTGVIVYRFCGLFSNNKSAGLLTSLALTLGTSVLPFAVSVFSHDCALLFSCLAVYLVVSNGKSERPNNLLLIIAGISLGIATLAEYACGLFALTLLGYIFFKTSKGHPPVNRSVLPTAIFIGSFSIVGVGLNLLYNYTAFGDPFTFPQSISISGVHFVFGVSLLEHLVYYLISPFRGVFFLSPILIVGAIGSYLLYRARINRPESFLFASLFFSTVVYYSAWQGWDGAWAYGPRFLIVGLPYLVIPISVVISENRFSRTVLVLFLWSTFIELAGAMAGASEPGRNSPFLFQLTSYAIPQILKGNSLVLWLSLTPSNSLVTIAYFVILVASAWFTIAKVKNMVIKELRQSVLRKEKLPLQLPEERPFH